MRARRWTRAGLVLLAISVLGACEAAIELNVQKLTAPESPAVDGDLRELARDHSQAMCAAGEATGSPDPEAVYGPGSAELVDRELLDPSLDPTKANNAATSAIWGRWDDEPLLVAEPWERVAVGEATCADGYLYMTLVLLPQPDPNAGLLAGAVALTAAFDHSCAVLGDGTARCWGENEYGQLGDGTVVDRWTPVPVAGLSDAVAIDAGYGHTCALLDDGTVRCWGSNSAGKLGDGTTIDRLAPVPVTGLTDVIAIDAGWAHTCALLDDGTVRCWGDNGFGQLGIGIVGSFRPTPVAVDGLTGVTSVTGGLYHSCATLEDGTARCWGNNQSRQLGDGTTALWQPSPVPVAGLAGATSVSGGYYHSCARLGDGTVRCWGENQSGQLGDGTTTSRPLPTPVSGLAGVTAVTAAAQHGCAQLADGTARCWGANGGGQVGDGTTAFQRLTPVSVTGLSGATALSASSFHTCALRGADGTVRCWGYNTDGVLGDGTTVNRSTPVAVLDG